MLLSRETFQELCEVVHRLAGIVVSSDREYLIRYRLEPIIVRHGLQGFDDLKTRLARGNDVTLIDAVVDAITTQETSFFRDADVFEALAAQVFPTLVGPDKPALSRARIWCAGTSTGQEAYSMAMLAQEFADRRPNRDAVADRFSIVATDISSGAIDKARAGVYDSREINRGLDEHRRSRFLSHSGKDFSMVDSLKRMIEFRRVNLMEPFTGLGQFQIICCRNVLIYFDESTRRRLCDQYHAMLGERGWLLLGAAENLYGISHAFSSVTVGKALIYQKT